MNRLPRKLYSTWRWLCRGLVSTKLEAQGRDAVRRAELIIALVMLVAGLGLARVVAVLLTGDDLHDAVVVAAGLGLCGALLGILRLTGSLRLAGNGMALLYFVRLSDLVYLRGGLGASTLMGLALTPLVATFVAGWRWGVVWAGLVLAEAAAYAVPGLIEARAEAVSRSSEILDVVLFTILVLGFGAVHELSRNAVAAAERTALTARRKAEAERACARQEARLLHADRMACMGQIAAGVAHEISTPLGYVMNNLVYLETVMAGSAPASWCDAARDARDGTERVARLARDLKRFSREDEDEEVRAPVDVRAVMDTAIKMADSELRARARVVKDYADTPPVLANEGRLAQVFLNLLLNAAQALPEGHNREHTVTASIRVGVGVGADADAGEVVVEVRDTGFGIPPELLARVTEPFFTTKERGVGTGLGLTVCKRIVDRHGGRLELDSDGAGTTARVVLPAVSGEVVAPRARTELTGEEENRYRLLIVDDDEAFLRAMRRLLRGHEVSVASSGWEAFGLLEQDDGYDLILCDLMMPEGSGMELYERLEGRDPALCARIVFLTGGAFTPGARSFLARVPNRTLEKPIALSTLARLLAELGSEVIGEVGGEVREAGDAAS